MQGSEITGCTIPTSSFINTNTTAGMLEEHPQTVIK